MDRHPHSPPPSQAQVHQCPNGAVDSSDVAPPPLPAPPARSTAGNVLPASPTAEMRSDSLTTELPAPVPAPAGEAGPAPAEASAVSLSETPAVAPRVATRQRKNATVSEMKTELAALGLDTTGKKETLYKRLLSAFTRSQEAAAAAAAAAAEPPRTRPGRQPHRSYLCFDVEGTCEAGTNFDYPNEIIEFPVVLLQWSEDDIDDGDEGSGPSSLTSSSAGTPSRRLRIIDTFHSYVRPTWRPKLSEFCVELTGIQQCTVDAAPTFPEVIAHFEQWLDSWDLREDDRLKEALWVTDGPWDLRDFLPKQLHITPLTPPRYPDYFLGPYLNIKRGVETALSSEVTLNPTLQGRGFKGTTNVRRGMGYGSAGEATGANRYLTIPGQLEALGLGSFVGRRHSGIDDATNIARILMALAERDILIVSNGFLPPARNVRRWPWMGKLGEVLWSEPMLEGVTPRPVAKLFDVTPPPKGVPGGNPTETTSGSATPPMLSNQKKKNSFERSASAHPAPGPATPADPDTEIAHDMSELALEQRTGGSPTPQAAN